MLLDQALAHCPKFLTADLLKPEPFLNSSVADHSFESTKNRRLDNSFFVNNLILQKLILK
jgi:hypothetical protein